MLFSICGHKSSFCIVSYVRCSPDCPAIYGKYSAWRMRSLSNIETSFCRQALSFDVWTWSLLWPKWYFNPLIWNYVVALRQYASFVRSMVKFLIVGTSPLVVGCSVGCTILTLVCPFSVGSLSGLLINRSFSTLHYVQKCT